MISLCCITYVVVFNIPITAAATTIQINPNATLWRGLCTACTAAGLAIAREAVYNNRGPPRLSM